jgi:hypothetical protein
VRIGTIYRHAAFYIHPETGEIKPKFLVALARNSAGDIVARLLTSRQHGRREHPPCFHGDPYPGYFLGIPGGRLTQKTWVDLRQLDDLDNDAVTRLLRKRVLTAEIGLPMELLLDLMECVAGAEDTTRLQEHSIRDELARLR